LHRSSCPLPCEASRHAFDGRQDRAHLLPEQRVHLCDLLSSPTMKPYDAARNKRRGFRSIVAAMSALNAADAISRFAFAS
jgi:hypothetical protein